MLERTSTDKWQNDFLKRNANGVYLRNMTFKRVQQLGQQAMDEYRSMLTGHHAATALHEESERSNAEKSL